MKRRPWQVLSAVLVIAMAVALPWAAGRYYEEQQLACFNTLFEQHAPLARYSYRVGPAVFSYANPSGSRSFTYRLSDRVEVDLVINRDGTETKAYDIPDLIDRRRETVGYYHDAWQLLRHPIRFKSSCR
jgi:hypothetical protein